MLLARALLLSQGSERHALLFCHSQCNPVQHWKLNWHLNVFLHEAANNFIDCTRLAKSKNTFKEQNWHKVTVGHATGLLSKKTVSTDLLPPWIPTVL